MSDVVNIFSIPSSTSSVVSAALSALTTVGTTIVAAAVVAALGATIFKWYETWHNAELASRALSGLTSNFARHCIYNMVRITQYSLTPSEFPSDTVLKKQKFDLSVVSNATKDRMQLIGTDLIFDIEALFLRLRNFNIEIEFARKNKTANNDIKTVLDYIILKNMQLAARSDKLTNDFDKLIEESKKMRDRERFYYIFSKKKTIFNENDFEPGAKKRDKLFSRPFPCKVDSILKTYLDDEGSEKKEYGELIKTYKRIFYDDYPGDLREWFGVKWTT